MMNTDSQQFKSFALAESDNFSSILEIMYHTMKKEGRLFLNLMNNIVDYILTKDAESNTVDYHIIHIPACPDWAREVLVRFIIHKVALTMNKTTINRFINSFKKIIINNDRKEVKFIQERNKYYRKLAKTFEFADIPCNKNKSIMIIKEQDLNTRKSNKNPWINEFFSKEIIETNHNLIISTEITAFDIEKIIKKFEIEDIPLIENVIIFHSLNKSKITSSYNKNQLDRLNRYGLGIKNCIVFSFSDQPLMLYQTIDNVKYRLASSLLNKTINKYDDFKGFITFTQEESDFLFKRKKKQELSIIDCQGREFFTYDIDQFLESIPNNLKYKNNLAMSFTDDLQNKISQDFAQEIEGFSKELCRDYFNLLKQLWSNDIKSRVEAFIGNSFSVGFIVSPNSSTEIKKTLLLFFQKPNRLIKFYSFEDFKHNINAEKLIVLQYRYTNKFNKVYPNSFDSLPLGNSQKALIVINRLTHNDYYEWNIYWYNKDLNGLLFSGFRKDVLKWEMKSFRRPISPEVQVYINEAENEARGYQTDKCRVFYSNGSRSKEYLACERVLCKENNSLRIKELKDITTIEDISIQILEEITEQVKELISKKSEDKTKSEVFLRKDSKFNLTEDEINSQTELWKILLKRKVEIFGVQAVYDAIFTSISENERITINTFNQWYDIDNEMILPRSRKHQIALLTYLGFEKKSPYSLIMIAKKLSNIKNSRFLNSQIEALLHKSLITEISEKNFESLSELHFDIFILLDIKNIGDLKALIDLLDISLIPVERIEYD